MELEVYLYVFLLVTDRDQMASPRASARHVALAPLSSHIYPVKQVVDVLVAARACHSIVDPWCAALLRRRWVTTRPTAPRHPPAPDRKSPGGQRGRGQPQP